MARLKAATVRVGRGRVVGDREAELVGANVKTMKDLRECVEGALQILLALFAIGLLALAPVYATRGHIDIAGTLAGLFLLSMLTLVLPRLRAIEAFGVKAQLAEEIRKAEITLDQLKSLARSSSRQGFLQVWSLPLAERRAVVETLNATMKAAEFTDEEQAELRRPIMDALARAMLQLGVDVGAHLKHKAYLAIDTQLKALPNLAIGIPDPHEAERARLMREAERLRVVTLADWSKPINSDTLPGLLDRCLVDYDRNAEDDRRFRRVLWNARRVMSESMIAGSLSPDAVDMVSFVHEHVAGAWNTDDLPQRVNRLLESHFGEG